MNTTLTFNGPASDLLKSAGGHKVRLGMILPEKNSPGILKLRPTDRKAGPHTIVDQKYVGPSNVVSIEINDQLKSSGGWRIPKPGTRLQLIRDRYGWFVLFPIFDALTKPGDGLVNVKITGGNEHDRKNSTTTKR